MTTTDRNATPEELAGVPSSLELTAIANQLFPDLTEGIDAVASHSGSVPAQPETAAIPGGAEFGAFDWQNPFGLPSVPAANAGTVQAYAPKVVSLEQAKESENAVSAGAANYAGAATGERTSGNDSIRIGSKTLAQIRNDFPILSEKVNGRQLVWLDNGATTQKPQAVIDRLAYFYEHENSNVHRGAHALAAKSTDAYENARNVVKDFIGAGSSEEIVFVRGTTEAINLVANSYVKPLLTPGDEIIVSILEHHANIVPWQLIAEQTGAVLKVIPCDETGQLILSEYEKLFTSRTKFVATTHVSNVLGTVTPIEELVAIAHRYGVRILIDGAQSIAHIPVNVSALDADFFVFSGHKDRKYRRRRRSGRRALIPVGNRHALRLSLGTRITPIRASRNGDPAWSYDDRNRARQSVGVRVQSRRIFRRRNRQETRRIWNRRSNRSSLRAARPKKVWVRKRRKTDARALQFARRYRRVSKGAKVVYLTNGPRRFADAGIRRKTIERGNAWMNSLKTKR